MMRADSFCARKEHTKMKYADIYKNNNVTVLKTVYRIFFLHSDSISSRYKRKCVEASSRRVAEQIRRG